MLLIKVVANLHVKVYDGNVFECLKQGVKCKLLHEEGGSRFQQTQAVITWEHPQHPTFNPKASTNGRKCQEVLNKTILIPKTTNPSNNTSNLVLGCPNVRWGLVKTIGPTMCKVKLNLSIGRRFI